MKKPLIVQKFGGTSMGSIESIEVVANHVINAKHQGKQVVVVVSAMSGETNRLMGLATQIDQVPAARELDVLLAAGEQVSMALLAMTLIKQGYAAVSLTGEQAGIITDEHFNDATITTIDTEKINGLLRKNNIVIVAGFQGVNSNGDITTLGRGGSDTSAVTLAGALDAAECQIFTDVDGIYTCDPRVVSSAKKLDVIDFPSMEEMARKGAKVLHLPCVQYAWKNDVPLRVLSTFNLNDGSLVKGSDGTHAVCGLSIQRDLLMVQFESDHFDSAIKHCQILGIDIWNVIDETEWMGIVIKQDASPKLALVFADKIRNSEIVSLLTVVGLQANKLLNVSCDLLNAQGIDVVHHEYKQPSLALILLPECVDKAANILHDAYITIDEAIEV